MVKRDSGSQVEDSADRLEQPPTFSDQLSDGNSSDKLIEQLREAVQARDDFLAIASHELRNPLTPILLCLELIRAADQSGDRAKLTNEIDRLERQIERFLARTNILLEVAQISSGRFSVDLSKVNLSELISGIVSDYAPLAARSGSQLTGDIQNGVIAIADRMAAAEIVENLLTNAIKYGQGKPIEVSLKATPQAAQIAVRDHGVGIDEKDTARIFERFERAVRRGTQPGFGIGLWLSRSLAEMMGGSITVFGKPGAGSLFTVSLPISPGEIYG